MVGIEHPLFDHAIRIGNSPRVANGSRAVPCAKSTYTRARGRAGRGSGYAMAPSVDVVQMETDDPSSKKKEPRCYDELDAAIQKQLAIAGQVRAMERIGG